MAPLTNQERIAQGIRLVEAGRTNDAVGLWQEAAAGGSVDSFYNIGLLYSKLAFATDDPIRQGDYIVSAISVLKPIAGPEFGLPNAAFSLGMLAEHLALKSLQAADLGQEQKLETAHAGLSKAADYFRLAAAMPDSQNNGIPAEAMLRLATYQLEGLGGFEKDEHASIAMANEVRVTFPHLFEDSSPLPPSLPGQMPHRIHFINRKSGPKL